MKGMEIAREAGEEDDIRLRHRTSRTLPLVADDQVVER
jgi:hypothetical protein